MSASVLPPCTSEMGISQVERLGGGPSLNNAMLREILGRGGGGGAAVGQPLHFSASAAAEEETAADLRCAPVGDDDADEEMATSRPSSPAEKRSRLESIVSNMQSSPQPVVNGCKKRKLYQPVQHETTTHASGSESEPEQEQEPTQEQESRKEQEPGVMRKLNTVRSQLSVMQERYSQLYKEQARRRSSSGVMGTSPTTSPDLLRPVQVPATPTRPDHLPPSSFIDYARRVLNADPRNREQEKMPQPLPGVEPATRHPTPADVEGLADALKAELSSSLTGLIDSIVSKWSRDRRAQAKAAEMTEQISPRAEILRRISQHNGRFPGPFAPSELPFGLSLSALRPPVNLPPLYPQKPFQTTMSTPSYGSYGLPPFCPSQPQEQESPLSLVVTPKRKRHKMSEGVMDPLAGSESPPSPPAPVTPLSRPSQPPLSLPSSAAESAYFSSYPYHRRAVAGSPPRGCDSVSPPSHPPTLLHPALLAAGRRSPPDGRAFRATPDRSDCSSLEGGFDAQRGFLGKTDVRSGLSLTADFSSTLTPLHLRKAKLMFYWTRYPSSTVLKSYFPDINFNKNNTAQLVKWFSNFREFFYIQMEKHARLALSEGIKSPEELHVTPGCELLRVLNLHYNRNNHIEIPANFPPLAESALREFFRAVQEGKDAEPSWKKAIYKVISRLDENVPEYFRSSSFLEQLE